MSIPEDEFMYHLQVLADEGIIEISKDGLIRVNPEMRKKGLKHSLKLVRKIGNKQDEFLKDKDEYPLRREFMRLLMKGDEIYESRKDD